ncbi:cupin domain-containing protein [Bdellovibrio sp. 22V]|uniref:cupin domain-containing protein n=1 Tax=Bdellovibrio TaxID=958 RepID=UPI002543C8C2|nr:cupin domain-containing protein [Bdellovibrio sp. 22V]WII72138.1 cupin domain-containing protein [Bdellovibrio sp. 22V]
MKIEKQNDRQHKLLKSQRTGEEFSLSSVISESLQSNDLFLSHEIIRPGARSSGAHFHKETDEIIYILKGSLLAVEGEDKIQVSEGDCLLFERNSGRPHYLINESEQEAQALLVRKKIDVIDVVYGVNS